MRDNRLSDLNDLDMILDRAARDAAFRRELLANPKATMERELDIDLPASLDISILQDSDRKMHIVLPAVELNDGMMELSNAEIEMVVGGMASGSTDVRSCLNSCCGIMATARGKNSY